MMILDNKSTESVIFKEMYSKNDTCLTFLTLCRGYCGLDHRLSGEVLVLSFYCTDTFRGGGNSSILVVGDHRGLIG